MSAVKGRPPRRWPRWALAGLLTLAALGCEPRSEQKLRVGVKSFTEQRILARALMELARRQGVDVGGQRDCGDTHGCWGALAAGRVDLIVAYSGTALSYRGLAPRPLAQSASRPAQAEIDPRLRAVDARRKLRWLFPLGFDNGYRLAVSSARGAAAGWRRIADLAKLSQGVRVACPRTYVGRPRDGLAALLRRHGLKLATAPLLQDDPSKRLAALLAGHVDVAVVYETDGALRGQAVTLLDDSLGFFPPYHAALVVREEALRRLPKLEKALAPLRARLDVATMREVNYQVAIARQPAERVAQRLLRDKGLVTDKRVGRPLPKVRVAHAAVDDLAGQLPRALGAIHKVFSGRRAQGVSAEAPLKLLRQGRAELALVGAERLFSHHPRLGPRLSKEVRAAAVVGQRMVHLLRRADEPTGAPLAGRLGIPPVGSSAGKLLATLLGRGKRSRPLAQRPMGVLIADLRAKRLDGVLLLAAAGDAGLQKLLAAGGLRLHALPRLAQDRALPFVHLGRIPAESYRGQAQALETLTTQVVLVAPAPGRRVEGGGPAAAQPNRGRPLTRKEERALIAAVGLGGAPDPLLVGAPGQALAADSPTKSVVKRVTYRLLNVLALAFLVWLGLLVMRGSRSS